jgi:branched-chain amino acid transport system permease protein
MQDIVNIVSLGAIYLLFAIGMSLVWGSIGILNLAHGSVFAFSAFAGYLVLEHFQLPIVAVVPICIATGAALSVLLEVLAFEPILARSRDVATTEFQILIGGLGVASVLLAIVQKVTTSEPYGFAGSTFRIHTYVWGSIRISNIQITMIIAGVVVAGTAAVWRQRSRSGLALRAIGVDAETASLMGIRRTALARATMAMSGGCAGLAGALLTYNLGSLDSSSGDTLLIKAFAAIILGGVGSIAGVVAGVLVLATAETLVLTYTSGTWVDAISFGLIMIVLLFRPNGLFGRPEVRRT